LENGGLTIVTGDMLTKLGKIMPKNSVRTSMKTQQFTITEINLLMLFKEIISVYSENNTKLINTT
jgi:hypothetical protein